MAKTEEGSVTVKFQKGFQELVTAVDAACIDRFGPRLAASYVAGSVGRCEAWPGASDLDWWAFLRNDLTAADKSWQKRARKRLERQFPIAAEVHLNIQPTDRLRQETFWRFILRYNAVWIRGGNLIAELGRLGAPTPRPSPKLARSRLPFVRTCLEEAVAGRCPPSLAELPSDPFLSTRKLARNFVIVEGAFALMAAGKFTSFKQEIVLKDLRRTWRRWSALTRTTEEVLADPHRAAVAPDAFMRKVHPFMDWAIELTEKS